MSDGSRQLTALKTRQRSDVSLLQNLRSRVAQLTEEGEAKTEQARLLGEQLKEVSLKLGASRRHITDLEKQVSNSVSRTEVEQLAEGLRCEILEKAAFIESKEEAICSLTAKVAELEMSIRELVTREESLLENVEQQKALEEAGARRENQLNADLLLAHKLHAEAIKSLESSHAIALNLVQQSSDATIGLLSRENSVLKSAEASSAVLIAQLSSVLEKQSKIEIRCATCQTDSEKTASTGSQTETGKQARVGVQTEASDENCLILSPCRTRQVMDALKCFACNSSRNLSHSIFPCGHGMCEKCFQTFSQSDSGFAGVECLECANSLPVTRISPNVPLRNLQALLCP